MRTTPISPLFDPRLRRGAVQPGSTPGTPYVPPPAMVLVGEVADTTHLVGALWVAAAPGLAIVSATDDDRVASVDLSDPANPVVLHSVQDASQLFVPQGSCIIGDHAFVAIPGPEARLTSINISNPAALTVAHSIQDSSAFSNAIWVKQFDATHVIVAGNEVTLVDVSDPTAMSVVRTYEPGAESQGGLGAYLSTYAVTDRPSGDVLRVVDMTVGPPVVTGSLTSSINLDQPNELVVYGDHAYVVAAGGGSDFIAIIDLSDPANPGFVTSIDVEVFGVQPWDKVALYGHYLIATYNSPTTLRAFDLSNPEAPTEYASLDTSPSGSAIMDDIAVAGDLVVWVDGSLDSIFVVELQNFAP